MGATATPEGVRRRAGFERQGQMRLPGTGEHLQMEATIERRILAPAVASVARLVAAHTSLPILRNVKLEATEAGCCLSATNLESGLELHLPAVCQRPGKVAVPGKLLATVLGGLNGIDVSLRADGDHLVVSAPNGEYRLKGLPEEEFPGIPEVQPDAEVMLPGTELRELLQSVSFLPVPGDGRPHVECLRVRYRDEQLSLAGVNTGSCFGFDRARVNAGTADFEVMLPVEAAEEMIRLLSGAEEAVRLTVNANQLAMHFTGGIFTSRLATGKYPNLDRHLDGLRYGTVAHVVKADRDDLMQMLRHLRVFSSDKLIVQTHLEIGDDEVRGTINGDSGHGNEFVPCEVQGDPVRLALDALVTTAVLSHLRGERVELRIPTQSEGPRPILLSSPERPEHVVVIQPLTV